MNADKHESRQAGHGPGRSRVRRAVFMVAITVFLSATGALLYALMRSEPTWNGRRLSSWLDDLRADSQLSRASQDQAEAAVRAIGDKSIPLLLTWMNSDDSPVKKAIYGSLPRGLQLRWHPQWAFDRQWMAATAFDILGTNAEPAIPKLSQLLGTGKRGRAAAAALGGVGATAFPVLTNLLAQQQTAEDAAYGLTRFGDEALPVLIRTLIVTNRIIHQAAFDGVHFCVYNQYIWNDPDRAARNVRSSVAFNTSSIGTAMATHAGREAILLQRTLDQCLASTNKEVATTARLLKTQLGL